jgi:hypothetical protein
MGLKKSLIPEHDGKTMKNHIPSTDYADIPHGISYTHFFGPSVAQARQRSEFHSCQARTKSIHEIWEKKSRQKGADLSGMLGWM